MSAISRAVAALAEAKIQAREEREPDAVVVLLDAAIGLLLDLPPMRPAHPTPAPAEAHAPKEGAA